MTALLSIAGPAGASVDAAQGAPITFENSGKCMNVAGASTADGASLIQYTCSPTATNDKWVFFPLQNGYYWIESVASNKCLTVKGASTADKAPLIQFACHSVGNEMWAVESPLDRPTMRLRSVGSGKCVNVPGGSTADHVGLVQYTCQPGIGTPNERFTLPPTASPVPVHRAFTSKQPVAAIQGSPGSPGATAPVLYSWIDRNNQLETVTDFNPDVIQPDPNAPPPSGTITTGYGYTGRPVVGLFANAYQAPQRIEVIAHEAAAGDIHVLDETQPGAGHYGSLSDIGGAVPGQPALGPRGDYQLNVFAIVNGSLWFDWEEVGNKQPSYWWRSIGGTGLTGTPAAVFSPDQPDTQVFASTTTGDVQTATLEVGLLSDWKSLGATGLSGMSALSLPGHLAFLTAKDTTGTVRYLEQKPGGTWPATWSSIPGVASAGAPSAVVGSADGKLDVAIRGAGNLLYVAQETTAGSGQFGGWTQISDPATDPDTAAASDPTTVAYDVPSGKTFGVVFQSTTDLDTPYAIYFPPAWTPTTPAAAVARSHTGLRYRAVTKPKTLKTTTAAK